MSKRILLIAFVVVCCVVFLPLSANATSPSDYDYEVLGDDICEITGYRGTETNISIPETLGGYKVINIRYDAFAHGNLTSVQIPDSVESIGDWAFWDNNITSVKIPDSVNYIAKSAFNDNAITSVDDEASNGIIYARTENGTEDKTTIVSYGGASDTIDFIPDNVTTIGPYAFARCGLESVSIPPDVTTIERGAFNVNAITSVNDETSDGIIYARTEDGKEDKTTIVSYGGVSNIVNFIPYGVTTIRSFAFFELESITLPTSITFIDQHAFFSCEFEEFQLPLSDRTWAEWLGSDGNTYSPGDMVPVGFEYKLIDYEYEPYDEDNCEITGYHGTETDISIPKTLGGYKVINIRWDAFMHGNLTSVIIPEGVESIGDWAFFDNNITSVTIPDSVIYIAKSAFNNNAITSVNGNASDGIIYARTEDGIDYTTIVSYGGVSDKIEFIPEDVTTTIGPYAFSQCGLTSVRIPSGVTTIERGAFNVNAITTVDDDESDGIIYARTEDGKEDKTTIVSYGGVSNKVNFIPFGVTTIGPCAFFELESITFPTSITFIDQYAFFSCEFEEFKLPLSEEARAEWLGSDGNTYSPGDMVPVGFEYKLTTVAPEEPSAQTGVVSGTLEDSSGNPLVNYQVTIYSEPRTTRTDANGTYTFSDVPYTHHTLVVADENGVEKGRVFLNFKKDSRVGATVSGNTVETTYTKGTIKVDFPIIVGESGISIDEEDVEVIENPQTGGSSMSMLYLIIALGTVLIVSGFFLAKRKLGFK